MSKKKTSIMVEEALWDEIKIKAIREKKEIGQLLEEILKKELKTK
jgi:predicted DNA-binding ribbon-helix-helix protein